MGARIISNVLSKFMTSRCSFCGILLLSVALFLPASAQKPDPAKLYPEDLDVTPRSLRSDKKIAYDFDIVYVRSPRQEDKTASRWTEIAHPALIGPVADLMLLHPDGREEVLMPGGGMGRGRWQRHPRSQS